jgi:hypothetical protein
MKARLMGFPPGAAISTPTSRERTSVAMPPRTPPKKTAAMTAG